MAHDVPDVVIPVETWTSLTSDITLVQHLLSLYFCWEYPTFASLSKEHFIKDFQQGRRRFCSSILVNALMALGCRFSSQPNTRAKPEDPYSSGDHYFKECQRLLYEETSHHTLTTIQALGIMSIREASCGRDSESWFYAGQSIKLAIEMGLHKIQDEGADEDEMAVQSATFWGAFALDQYVVQLVPAPSSPSTCAAVYQAPANKDTLFDCHPSAWSLATGSLPQGSSYIKLPPKPSIIDDIEASLWIPYTDDGKLASRRASGPVKALLYPYVPNSQFPLDRHTFAAVVRAAVQCAVCIQVLLRAQRAGPPITLRSALSWEAAGSPRAPRPIHQVPPLVR